MSEQLSALFDYARLNLLVAAIVFLRVGATMSLLPAFGERVVPARIRLVLAMAFTAVVAPAVAPGLRPRSRFMRATRPTQQRAAGPAA